jgi:DNA-binding response OmpR family regulator
MEAAVERTLGLAGERPVTIIAEYPAHLPTVQGEREKIIKVIASLVAEAVFLTQRGEVRVRAEILSAGEIPQLQKLVYGEPEALAADGPWAMVRVRAMGDGVTDEALEDLSAAFQRPNRQLHTSRDGIPLPECEKSVEGYGGKIWVEKLLNEGLRISLALPLRAAKAVDTNFSSIREAVEKRLPEEGEVSKSVLLFVEESSLRDWLSRDLTAMGYGVIVETEGSNVLTHARSEEPDLILLDMDARDPNAFDIAMVLKQDALSSSIPLLFITSVADPELGVRMEPVDFVVRASGTGKLIAAINEVLGSGLSPSARVLVAESDDATRENIILMIQSRGYRVTEAKGAEEAMALAERLEPDLALVNAGLAQERDYWLIRGLRQLSHDLEVFVLAEVIDEAEGRAAISRGASGYSETGKLRELLDDMRERQSNSKDS